MSSLRRGHAKKIPVSFTPMTTFLELCVSSLFKEKKTALLELYSPALCRDHGNLLCISQQKRKLDNTARLLMMMIIIIIDDDDD